MIIGFGKVESKGDDNVFFLVVMQIIEKVVEQELKYSIIDFIFRENYREIY